MTEPINMILFCPRCGMQHIDKDNYEEVRIAGGYLFCRGIQK